MSRLLFWIGLAVLVVMAVRSKLRALQGSGTPPAGAGPGAGAAHPQAAPQIPERMACCARCGVHFPSSEAVTVDGREYCCPAHAASA